MTRAALAIAVALVASLPAFAAWVAPQNPETKAILREAAEDATAGRYSDALDKQLWIHNESLKHSQGFYGVRLSFALSQWVQLGDRYPPALDALRRTRDVAAARVRTDRVVFEPFHDASAINSLLGEDERTAELFVWLDANRPEVATSTYSIAHPALLSTRNYGLYGKYIDGPGE